MHVPPCPFDQGLHPQGNLLPSAVILHRTYGKWAGDYSVGKNGRAGQGIGFHFLIGKENGKWVQFYDTKVAAAHALGANTWAIGIEFEGTNADRLTEWQARAGAVILNAVTYAHNIPLTYSITGPRRKIYGCLPHLLVPGSTHTDWVSMGDWQRMKDIVVAHRAPAIPPPPVVVTPPAPLHPTPPIYTIMHLGDTGDNVAALQFKLNALSGQPWVDGKYGPATYLAVTLFQRFAHLPETGTADPTTQSTLDAFLAMKKANR